MSEERIMTLHPEGKKGVNILKSKYDIISAFILNKLREHDSLTFESLSDQAVEALSDTFDGKVLWYVVSVKLDLEARGIIERIPGTSPHQLKLKQY